MPHNIYIPQRNGPDLKYRYEDAYRLGYVSPHYPVPTMIGEVVFVGNVAIIIEDCDDCFDPRLVTVLDMSMWPGEVYADYPHNSPNYR